MSILNLCDLSFSYDKKPVLEHVNFNFEPGKIYSIVGKSGAGKTTLLSLLSGLASPTAGTIYYKAQDIKKSISMISGGIVSALFSRILISSQT